MELDHITRVCNVEVWDLSAFLNGDYSKKLIYVESLKSNIIRISSWRELLTRFRKLKSLNKGNLVCVKNTVAHYTLSYITINLILSMLFDKKFLKVFNIAVGNFPVASREKSTKSKKKDYKALFRKVAGAGLFTSIHLLMIKALSRVMPNPTTHILYSGEDWYQIAQRMKGNNRGSELFPVHSYDYSNALIYLSSKTEIKLKKGICFLDCPTPMFISDYDLLKHKVYNTVENWYPALCNLFATVEKRITTSVTIAGHYKTAHPPNPVYFDSRDVIYDKTIELVDASGLVITQFSTAISYAVIFRKPVLFIFSNELIKDSLSMADTLFLADQLGTKAINIDDFKEDDLNFNINESKYLEYEMRCLSSNRSGKPNHKIILEDILDIC